LIEEGTQIGSHTANRFAIKQVRSHAKIRRKIKWQPLQKPNNATIDFVRAVPIMSRSSQRKLDLALMILKKRPRRISLLQMRSGKSILDPAPLYIFFIFFFATVHFYNQSKEKGIKATGIGIE
jgi:hypothetical protein